MSRHNESPVKVGMGCHLSFFTSRGFVPKFLNFLTIERLLEDIAIYTLKNEKLPLINIRRK